MKPGVCGALIYAMAEEMEGLLGGDARLLSAMSLPPWC